ncbi:MAG: glycosyl hydrolase [Ferruginibacter sp.]|nr:glycosyl hydrolase [Ferruginibacter sp.]
MKKFSLSIALLAFNAGIVLAQANLSKPITADKVAHWLQQYDFDPAAFAKPSLAFGPMARWWWPGNDVTNEELQREINLFADHGFAGVEVQPLSIGLPLLGEVRARVLSWDSPSYYEHLKTVMETARKRQMVVDVTNGSGWPPGGSFLNAEDGFLSLEFGAATIEGGKKVTLPVPPVVNKTAVPSRLQAVVASKIIRQTAGSISETEMIDAASTLVLTSFVRNDTLQYAFPAGQWKLISFWAIPSGEQTNIAAAPKGGPVVDHFDSLKVLKLYNHLFGERTGMQPYFGTTMRAVFNDSYEFKANRHYSPGFINYFKQKRGYDITPWLPAIMQKGYNFVEYLRPNASPSFSFSPEDWRLRYDYDLTLGDLLGEHFFKTSKTFLECRGLLHRTQAYGLNMDMIAMAGQASIPETESMLGAEANIKVMTSGGHLYNRPIITAESVVFLNRAYTITPQKIRLAVDKLFAAGVNQVIYHGVPYRYTPDKLGVEGWNPFSTPFIPGINFSSNLGEGNIFWQYQQQINEYVTRTQYALRSGRPHADVLIYYPFLNVEKMPDNPEEILTKGFLEGVEGRLPVSTKAQTPKNEWAEKVYPLINYLEANGITWEWVNDASIQEATLATDKQVLIRGNRYQALVLANDSIIHLKTAAQINKLARAGMNFMATGNLPGKQPSFFNWKENDRKTAQFIKEALKQKNSVYINNEGGLEAWSKTLHLPVKFQGRYNFTRQVQREMSDGSRIHFIWNKSAEWQELSLTLDKKFNSSTWMNAADGTITRNVGTSVHYGLPPYSAVLLLSSTKNVVAENVASPAPVDMDLEKQTLVLDKWQIKVDSVEIINSTLFDWKQHEHLKYSSAEGIYSTSFDWKPGPTAQHYFLDLGKVCFTADVRINGASVGKRIFAPYMLDITSLLKPGTNQITIRVTPGQLNSFIGNAKSGDKRYAQFKGKEEQLMSAGLIGPVIIRPGKQ